MFYSQIGQDKYYIENIIRRKRNGKFLDIGAHNGILTSNTYSLEKDYGWSGICVEANYDLYKECLKNRNCYVFHGAAWKENTLIEFDISKEKMGLLSRISNIKRNENYFNDEFKRNNKKINMNAYNIQTIVENFYELPINFDYMSLDVEGAELEVLQGIDFDKISIDFIATEHGNREYYLKELNDFMQSKSYEVHRINKWDVEYKRKIINAI